MKLHMTLTLAAVFAFAVGCGETPPAANTVTPDTSNTPDTAAAAAEQDTMTPDITPAADAPSEYEHVLAGLTMTGLDGTPVALTDFHGKVILFVNVASKCGNTKQYAGLQNLHERYFEQGLAIIGVPSNDFNGQEPGTAEEIAEFCTSVYGVQFAMLDKVSVKGEQKCELYRRLTDPANDPTAGAEVQWNFEKFLVGRDGRVVNRFRPKVQPESEEVVAAIEMALAGE